MGSQTFEGWHSWLEDVYVVCTPDDPDCLKHTYITKTEKDEPFLTIEDEIALMSKQVCESEGFDIDFSMFRCLFNYHLVDPNDHIFVLEPENDWELMIRLSQESLKRYNEEQNTKFEFHEVEKAVFHWCCGYMCLITFQVSDDDSQKKTFQARVFYSSYNPIDYVFCRPKPDPQVETLEEDAEIED